MTREELAKAYADGFNKEYQQIAYDAFLCGYGAKCESFVSEGLEKAAEKYAERLTTEPYLQVVHKTDFIAGAEWMKDKDQKTIELAEDHAMLAGMNKMEQQMMEKGYVAFISAHNTIPVLPMKDVSDLGLDYGDKVRVIVIKEEK